MASNEKTSIILAPAESKKDVIRYSSLKYPTIALKGGHTAEILSISFNQEGNVIASAGSDKQILLWNVFGDCENTQVLRPHSRAITTIAWNANQDSIFSASADRSICLSDIETGELLDQFDGHEAIVNSIAPTKRTPLMLASVSDDSTARMWDTRTEKCVFSMGMKYPMTAVTTLEDGITLLCGGIDNTIHMIDVRNSIELESMDGHKDTITSLSVSPDGNFLLSNAMDNTLKIWDVRPFSTGSRCKSTIRGHMHSTEKRLMRSNWMADGNAVAAGSSDGTVVVFDVSSMASASWTLSTDSSSSSSSSSLSSSTPQPKTPTIWMRLPGHKGSVTDVIFHPTESIIASASVDKQVIIGEFKPMAH